MIRRKRQEPKKYIDKTILKRSSKSQLISTVKHGGQTQNSHSKSYPLLDELSTIIQEKDRKIEELIERGNKLESKISWRTRIYFDLLRYYVKRERAFTKKDLEKIAGSSNDNELNILMGKMENFEKKIAAELKIHRRQCIAMDYVGKKIKGSAN